MALMDDEDTGIPYTVYTTCVVCDYGHAYKSFIKEIIMCPNCGAHATFAGEVLKIDTGESLD